MNMSIPFCILFYLAQKGEYNKKIVLDKLVHLFGVGKVYKHSQNNNWFYRVNGLSNTKVLIIYFYNSKFTNIYIYFLLSFIISFISFRVFNLLIFPTRAKRIFRLKDKQLFHSKK